MRVKLTFQQQLIAFILLFISVLVLFYFFAWSPQSEELASIAKQRSSEEQKIKMARATLARLEGLKESAPKIEAKIIKIGRKMPKDPDLPGLIVQIQNMANDSSVSVDALKPNEPQPASGYSKMDVSLSIKGTYAEISEFLFRIENSHRAMRVDNLSISPADNPTLQASLTISTFVLGGGSSTRSIPPAVSGDGGGKAQ